MFGKQMRFLDLAHPVAMSGQDIETFLALNGVVGLDDESGPNLAEGSGSASHDSALGSLDVHLYESGLGEPSLEDQLIQLRLLRALPNELIHHRDLTEPIAVSFDDAGELIGPVRIGIYDHNRCPIIEPGQSHGVVADLAADIGRRAPRPDEPAKSRNQLHSSARPSIAPNYVRRLMGRS